jgi:HAD superfamily hydrolase (TIGR01549 family)
MTATTVLSAAHTATLPSGPVSQPRRRIAVAAFDVGETLIDETRIWSRWADRLGVTRLSLLGALGAMAAAGRPHQDAFELFRPGIDLDVEIARWAIDEPSSLRVNFDADDLYPDVRDCFARLHAAGIGVVIAGNQPRQARDALVAMDLGVDRILISDEIGHHKPQPEFFLAVAETAGVAPAHVAYVGDRVDNDVLPARRAGMSPILIRRGPWGHLQARWPEAAEADHIVDSLVELPPLLTHR